MHWNIHCSQNILLLCCVACDVWVTVSVYRVITAVGRGWTGWIFTMTILSFLCYRLASILCPSLHTMIHLQPISLVLHTHTSSLNIHYTGTKLKEAPYLSASIIFTLFTHYTADKKVGNMKYSEFEQNQDKQKDKCFIF